MGVYSCAKKPKFVAIENVEIQGVTDTLLMLRLDYIIYNPNRSKTELKDSEMLIYYKDTLVGKGWLENSTQLSPRDTLRIPVHFEVNIPKLAKYYPELLRYEKAKFNIKGKSKPIANWKLDELIVMNSMELQELTADVTTNNFNLMSGLNLKWLFLRKVDFIMEGQMEIEMGGYKFTVPIEDSQFIDLSDLVGMNR